MSDMSKDTISRLLEALAYIAEKAPDNKKNMYNVLKVFYLADKLHMERFGRFIFGDAYCAMQMGPVPSNAYDLVKAIRDGKKLPFDLAAPVSLLEDHTVVPHRSADTDYFSGSDLLCIDEVIELSNSVDLGDISHDEAWQSAERNRIMPLEAIISTLNNSGELLELHNNRHP